MKLLFNKINIERVIAWVMCVAAGVMLIAFAVYLFNHASQL